MQVKIKENALEIFFENTNISDDPKYYEEIKNFIITIKEKGAYLQHINEQEKIANLSQYERSKSFEVPIQIIDLDDNENQDNQDELFSSDSEISHKIFHLKKIFYTLFSIIIIILIWVILTVNITNNTIADNSKSQLKILTEQKNNNNDFIQKELEKQKEFREIKKQLNEKINKSKELVKQKLLDNEKLQIKLIENAQ